MSFHNKKTGLYLHFPFCVRKCRYCDFLSFSADDETKIRYAEALINEIRAVGESGSGRIIDSIFLGGGTPSVMPAGALQKVMDALYSFFDISDDAEITMELNPGTVTPEILDFIKGYVNRVSMGVQSADDRELRTLGRIHTWQDACRTYELLRKNGIQNINIDLISAVPGQTVKSWKHSLAEVCRLEVQHISAYSLIIEEGTPFYEMQENGGLLLPDEDDEREMYYETKRYLETQGFHRYEISNYAKDGFECRHNKKYWERGDYLGLGIGAASLFAPMRWRNTRSMKKYLAGSGNPPEIRRDAEKLSRKDEIEEFMFLGLREMKGISEEDFQENFGMNLFDVYGDILTRLENEKLIDTSCGRWYLTDYGIDISNRVLADFIL